MKKSKRFIKKILVYMLCLIMATNSSITTLADTVSGGDVIGDVSDGKSVLIEDLAEEKCEECGEYSCVCVPESSETEESVESSEAAESSEAEESTESGEAAESSENEESTESSEAAESSETEESTESSEAAESIESTESTEAEESTESTESTENEEKSESAESIESTESTETEESSETTEIVEETNAALENLMQILPAGAEVPENCTEVYTYVDINGIFEVTVCAPEGALPEGAVLAAEVLAEDSEAYAEAEAAIAEEHEYDGMVALDIRFEKDGAEVEPGKAVYVFINIREMLPETADPESVAVQHHAEVADKILGLIPTGNTEVEVSVVADNTAETGIVEAVESTAAEAVDVVAAFAVDEFSVFTVTWVDSGQKLLIHYWDATTEPHKEIDAVELLVTPTRNNGGIVTINECEEALPTLYVGQYVLKHHGLSDWNGSESSANANTYSNVANIKYDDNWYYQLDNSTTWELWEQKEENEIAKTRHIHFYYIKKGMDIVETAINENIRVDLFNYGSNINDKEVRILDFMNSVGADAWYKFVDGHGILDQRTSNTKPVMSRTLGVDKYPYVMGFNVDPTNEITTKKTYKLGGDNKLAISDIAESDYAGLLNKVSKNGDNTVNHFGSLKYLFDKEAGYVAGTGNWESYDYYSGVKTFTFYDRPASYREPNTAYKADEAVSAYQNLRKDTLFDPQWGYGTPYRSMHFSMQGDGGLFQRKDGYYQYSSAENAAYFDGSRFVIYDGLLAPGHMATNQADNSWKNYMPFDKPGNGFDASSTTVNTYDIHRETGKTTYILGYNYNGTDRSKNVDMKESVVDTWYGMSMEIDFFMPKSGEMDVDDTEAVNMQPMVFEFSGDDDVWVYLDDVLILDIGGQHGRRDGIINFKTGDVSFPAKAQEAPGTVGITMVYTNLKQLYQLAFLESINKLTELSDLTITQESITALGTKLAALTEEERIQMNAYLEEKGFDPNSDSNTYVDYTKHHLNFYYMERGGNIGFCSLKFNMPALPENSVTVVKDVENDPTAANKKFEFRIEVKDADGDPLTEVEYVDQDGNSGILDLNDATGIGTFELATDEFYTFKLATNYTYKVIEVEANKNHYTTTWNDESKLQGKLDDTNSVYLVCTNTLQPSDVKTDKSVSGTSTDDLKLTLEAYATGEITSISTIKPADIVMILDQSGSMLRPQDSAKLTKADLNTAEAKAHGSHGLYYVAYGGTSVNFLLYINDKWYRYETGVNKNGVGNMHWDNFIPDMSHILTDTDSSTSTDGVAGGEFSNFLTEMNDEHWTNFETNGIYQTRYGATYDAMVKFVSDLNAKGIGHRIAIVGFGGAEEMGSALYSNGVAQQYNSLGDTEYKDAFQSVTDDYEEIIASLNALHTNQTVTAAGVGLNIAKNIYKHNEIENDARDRITILFSDGADSGQNNPYGDSYAIKDEYGGKIYSVAAGEAASATSAETFLKHMSSNYPNAQSATNTGTEVAQKYYFKTDSTNSLQNAFNSIMLEVSGVGVTLDKDAVLRDTISGYFKLPDEVTQENVKQHIKVFTSAYQDDGTFSNTREDITNDADVIIKLSEKDGLDVVEVSGFDYSDNFVAINDTTKKARGKKLVVEIPIDVADSNDGGTKQETNLDDESGIYDGAKQVEDFPQPYADVPVTVTVKKVVEGTDTSDSFELATEYDRLNGYDSIETGVVGDSNYLKAKVNHVSGKKELRDSTLYPQDIWNIENIVHNTEITITEDIPAGYQLDVTVTYLNDEDVRVPYTNFKKLENGIKVKALKGMEVTFVNTVGDVFTDKYVTEDGIDKLWVNLEAYTTGKAVTVNSIVPMDVVFLLDQSSSMHKPEMSEKDLLNDVEGRAWGMLDTTGTGVYTREEFKAAVEAERGYENASQYCYWIARGGSYTATKEVDGVSTEVTYTNVWYKIQYDAADKQWELTPSARTNAPISANDCHDDEKIICKSIDEFPVGADKFYVTQYGRMYEAVRDFVEDLKAKGGDHRVAIVGFAGYEEGNTEGCSYIVGNERIYPSTTLSATDYENIMLSINDDGDYAKLQQAVKMIDAGFSGTCTAKGFDMVAQLLQNVETDGRERIAILVSDGNPYRPYDDNQVDTSEGQEDQAADNAVFYSQFVKAEATLYTIGTTVAVKKEFLEYASSKYPKAQNMTDTWEAVDGTFSYHCQDVSQENSVLNAVIKTIGSTVMEPMVLLDAESVLRDTISEHFQLDVNEDEGRTVKVFTAACTGKDSITGLYTFAEKEDWKEWKEGEKLQDSDTAVLDIKEDAENKIVEVKGFDYSKYFVAIDGGNPVGRKIIVQIPIKADDSNIGGEKQPTNDDENTGIYDEDEKVEDFPDPFADVPTTVTVKKIVNGTQTNDVFDFTIKYRQPKEYDSVDSEVADGSNYLKVTETVEANTTMQLKHNETDAVDNVWLNTVFEISEQLAKGYKIQSVTAKDADGKAVKVTYNSTNNTYNVNVVPGLEITFINEKADLILDKEVEQDGEDFKLNLNAFVTGSNGVVSQINVPADIVLVLDESGSMDDCVDCGHEIYNHRKNNTQYPLGAPVVDNDKGEVIVDNWTAGNRSESWIDVEGPDGIADCSQFIVNNPCKTPVYAGELDTSAHYLVIYGSVNPEPREIAYCDTCDRWFTVDDSRHSTANGVCTVNGLSWWEPFSRADAANNVTPDYTPDFGENGDDDGYHVQFYAVCNHNRTRASVLKAAANDFMERLEAKAIGEDGEVGTKDDLDFRVAVTGYGNGDMGRIYTSDTPLGFTTAKLNTLMTDAQKKNVATALRKVLQERAVIDKAIESVGYIGSTPTHEGMKAAELVYQYNPLKEGENRNRVVILFTDGSPGAGYRSKREWANAAIANAHTIKNEQGATIYCVGLFEGAECDSISPLPEYIVNGNEGNANNPQFFKNGNRVLHLISSNYPKATNLDNTGAVAALKEGQNYYMSTENQSGLEEIFNQLSSEMTDGSTTSALDKDTILRDVISDDFVIRGKAKAWTESFNGYDAAGNRTWVTDEGSSAGLTIKYFDKDGKELDTYEGAKTVEVTGFEYSEHFVHEVINADGSISYQGKRIFVEIPIEPSADNKGGIQQATNDNGSEIEDDDEPVKPFPDPYVDVPAEVKISKVVVGTAMEKDFQFFVSYQKFTGYDNDTSLALPDSNYLVAKSEPVSDEEKLIGHNESVTIENIKLFEASDDPELDKKRMIVIREEVLAAYTTRIEVKIGSETFDTIEEIKSIGGEWDYANRQLTIPVQPDMEVIFTNVDLYELPSTGGAGIYLYMLSGMLMMMAGALMIYKNKRKEVQRS